MDIYEIIFCFLKSDGSVETDEYGCEMYHREELLAMTEKQAKELFYSDFKVVKPEIVEIIRRK